MRVCPDCIEEPALQEFVRMNADDHECDFCGAYDESEPIACSILRVANRIESSVRLYYAEPIDELPYDSAEGGYQGVIYEIEDVLEDLGFCPTDERVFFAVIRQFDDRAIWCPSPGFLVRSAETLTGLWSKFCGLVKHQRRFTFWDASEESHTHASGSIEDDVAPLSEDVGSDFVDLEISKSDILSLLQDHLISMVRRMHPGEIVYRARVLPDSVADCDVREMTSPPPNRAVSSRMSPAGISMFYGALDEPTAVIESANFSRMNGKRLWIAGFRPTRTLRCVDLTLLPEAISEFEEVDVESFDVQRLLAHFRREIALPIEKDGREHIEYVPTQIITELIRFRLRTAADEPFDGVVFPSSKTRGKCVSLFASQQQCLRAESNTPRGEMLQLIPETLRCIAENEFNAYRRRPEFSPFFEM